MLYDKWLIDSGRWVSSAPRRGQRMDAVQTTKMSLTMSQPTDHPETVVVDRKDVSCDGDGGALGHPRVYLTLERGGRVECPYCDRLFVLETGPATIKH